MSQNCISDALHVYSLVKKGGVLFEKDYCNFFKRGI